MAKVELKQPIVDEIKAQLDGAKSMVVVDYRGISVADVTELRKQCREAGVVYKVYKNTMVKRAVEGTEFEGVVKDLEGTNAFAISKDDATAPARIVANFIKKAKCCELKSGVVTYRKIPWKHSVPNYKLCPRNQTDRRAERWWSCRIRSSS